MSELVFLLDEYSQVLRIVYDLDLLKDTMLDTALETGNRFAVFMSVLPKIVKVFWHKHTLDYYFI